MAHASVAVLTDQDQRDLVATASAHIVSFSSENLERLSLAVSMERSRRQARDREYESGYQQQNRCPACQGDGKITSDTGMLVGYVKNPDAHGKTWQCGRCQGDGKYHSLPPVQSSLLPKHLQTKATFAVPGGQPHGID